MHIAIIAPGSRGDVEPYIALGVGLARAGHGVRLVSHADFAPLAAAHGLAFYPIEGRVQEIAQGMGALLERGNFLAILSQMGKDARSAALNAARAGLAACRGVDLVLAGIGGLFVGLALAEKLHLPLLQAYYIPFTPTAAYPSFLAPRPLARLGGRLNRASYTLAQQMLWQAFRPADGLARRQALDLPAAPLRGPFDAAAVRGMPVIYGYSPTVIPPPPDWGPDVHVTGYWVLDPNEDWTPPPALAEFLQAGAPPVYVGFGSMSSSNPAETADLVLRALAQTGQRAVVLAGWGGLQVTDLPASVYMLDAAPFAWLFPRMAAVVHHGGAGTIAAGLRAGVPSVVVPFFGDQPFWGRRVADLGAGPAPIPRKKLTVDRLAAALRQAVSDPAMRQRAVELGRAIRAEDGVARAVAVVGQLAAGAAG